METGEISYCRRHVDDIRITFKQNKINEQLITNYMNNVHKYLAFKKTEEDNNITYLDLSIHKNNNDLQLGVYTIPTQTDNITHFTTNHPLEHKLSA
jgi:hypothetical protein